MADPFDFSALPKTKVDPFDFSKLPKTSADPFDFSKLPKAPPVPDNQPLSAIARTIRNEQSGKTPQPAPKESIGAGMLRGTQEGFGSEPIGMSPENLAKFPTWAQPVAGAVAKPIDLFTRLMQGATGGLAGGIGAGAQSPALERDLRAAMQVGPAAEMGAGLTVPKGGVSFVEGANPRIKSGDRIEPTLADPRAAALGPKAVESELAKPVEQPLPTAPGTVTHPKPNITSIEGAPPKPTPPDALAKALATTKPTDSFAEHMAKIEAALAKAAPAKTVGGTPASLAMIKSAAAKKAPAPAGHAPYIENQIKKGENFFADAAKKEPAPSLPMDEPARQKRAQSMGFNPNQTFYHGLRMDSKGNLEKEMAFHPELKLKEPAVFVTDKPEIAKKYAHSQTTLKLWGKIQNPLEINWPDYSSSGAIYNGTDMAKLIKDAKAAGHDVVIIKNINDLGGVQTQWAFIKPENLRSASAATFDPKKAASPNLLSAAAPPTTSAKAPAKYIGAPGPSLGGPEAIPEAPTRGYISKLSDQLYTHDRTGDADKIELLKWVKSLPDEAVALKQKFFEYLEPGNKKPTLAPEEKAAFDKYLKPLIQEQKDLYEEIKKLAPDMLPGDYDPDYVHHMVKGRVTEFDVPLGETSADEGLPYQSKLPQTTRSLKASRYYALDNGSGHRQVVMLDDKGNLSLMQNKKPISIPPKDITFPAGGTDVKPGESLTIGGKEWKIARASVAEKEEATPYQYHKDAFASTVGNLVRLRKVSRAVKWFDNLKTSPEWANYAQRMQASKTIPKGWREPRMPLFRGWAVDGHLADLIDDYYGQRGPIEEKLAKINQAVVGTLFWQPVTHGLNVAAHWTVGRGWDWLNVPQWAGYARDMASAVKDVTQQGPITQALLKEGSAQMLPRVLNREFYSNVLKALGEDLKSNKKYDSMWKTLGVKPIEFYKSWMKKSNEALWYLNDVFMTHRVLELKRKGMSTSQAIKEAEKHIPNYRLPPRVMNSRMISRYLGSGAASEFGRFHYNVWNSYAHMARDLVKGTGKERVDALGHVMALGVLGMLVWPAVSAGIAKLTGNPRDRASPRGPLAAGQDMKDLLTMLAPETTAKIGMSPSERTFGQIIQNVLGLSPMLNQAATQLTGHNPYTNQAVSTLGERAQAAADTLNPSQILTDLWSGRMNPVEEALKSTVGIQRAKAPTPPQIIKQQMRTQAKNAGKQPVDSFITWIGQELRKAGVQP